MTSTSLSMKEVVVCPTKSHSLIIRYRLLPEPFAWEGGMKQAKERCPIRCLL